MIEDLKIAKYGLRGSEEGFGFEAMLERGGGIFQTYLSLIIHA